MHKRFNRGLIALLMTTVFGVSALAAPSSSSTTVSGPTYKANPITLDFSGGLVTIGGRYGGVFLTGVSLPVERNSPVRLAFDTGVLFGGGTWLPILLSAIYNFGEARQTVRPYIGGAIGPVIRLSGPSVTINGIDIPVPNSLAGDGVRLAILVRPGLKVFLTHDLDLTGEIAFGGLTGIFYISPSMGIQLKL